MYSRKDIIEDLTLIGTYLDGEEEIVLVGTAAILLQVKGFKEFQADDIDVATDVSNNLILSSFVSDNAKHVIDTFPHGWEHRTKKFKFGKLIVILPSLEDLVQMKLQRGEQKDMIHLEILANEGFIDLPL